jgi:hypothetical protein
MMKTGKQVIVSVDAGQPQTIEFPTLHGTQISLEWVVEESASQ